MADFDYEAKRATAERLIKKFGAAGQFVLESSIVEYDDYGNEIPPADDVVIDGIITPLLPISKDFYENGSVEMGDKGVFFHSEIAPAIGYAATISGEKWRVVAILQEITSVDGVNVFRYFQVRK